MNKILILGNKRSTFMDRITKFKVGREHRPPYGVGGYHIDGVDVLEIDDDLPPMLRDPYYVGAIGAIIVCDGHIDKWYHQVNDIDCIVARDVGGRYEYTHIVANGDGIPVMESLLK